MAITNTTVAEIAAESLAAVRVFERLGIDYCCGGKRPLDEVCSEKGLSADAVRSELDAAMAASAPGTCDWATAPLRDLIDHIVGTHHEYLRRELPALAARVEKVHRVYTGRNLAEGLPGLPETFGALRTELEAHMAKEEVILFPMIAAGIPHIAKPIRVMEFEHESAGDALARIRQITRDHSVPDYACVTYRAMLAGLKELETDLHLHIHLENNILFPRALRLVQDRLSGSEAAFTLR
ncbi:MAG TPA: iron-sulfur cluster repair di-iron protein [Bryobacteraceae bacterium]|nr:iron-sulfur cluster repair di-iron protein [Bryobacteraceae bacterium]